MPSQITFFLNITYQKDFYYLFTLIAITVFRFSLPESNLPCSFESKACYIRYFFKVTIDIPYASPPQGIKYFTVLGPYIDCMDEQYLVSVYYNSNAL